MAFRPYTERAVERLEADRRDLPFHAGRALLTALRALDRIAVSAEPRADAREALDRVERIMRMR
jgi:hypothetical protein